MAKYAIGAAVILTFIGLFVTMGLYVHTLNPIESGTYTGQKIDYSHQRGLIFQTNDLTTKTNDRSSTREDWCIPDDKPELVEEVRSLEPGQQVEIQYYNPVIKPVWECQSSLKVVTAIN